MSSSTRWFCVEEKCEFQVLTFDIGYYEFFFSKTLSEENRKGIKATDGWLRFHSLKTTKKGLLC